MTTLLPDHQANASVTYPAVDTNLLLLSNSRVDARPILSYAEDTIKRFLGEDLRSVLFIPYAAVRDTYDAYAAKVASRFDAMGYVLTAIHACRHPREAIERAEAIVVGGGNTFCLLNRLYQEGVMSLLRERVLAGIPYIGWSAGANLACPTIKTTNDMPIVAPVSLNALNLVSWQINPHYTEALPPGHYGETREERIAEFICLNRGTVVIGLPEGCLLRVNRGRIHLAGVRNAKIFGFGRKSRELVPGEINSQLAAFLGR